MALAQVTDLPLPMAKLDTSVALTLFPQASTGIDCMPALRGHRNGAGFAHSLRRTNVSVDDFSIQIELEDDAAELTVVLQIETHDSGVLSVTTELCNTGESEFTVDHLASATLPLPPDHSQCLTLHGRWGLEFQTHRSDIGPVALRLENNRGRTSHECYPGFVTGVQGFSEQFGAVQLAQLAWSGSHCTTIEQLSDGRRYMQTGIAVDPGELTLAAGQSITTPSVYVIRSHGINRASQAMHSYARRQLLPPWTRTPRPVHANSWEALYFDHDLGKLYQLIDAAKAIGAERFILDDGWFKARRSDNAGLGDWTVDRAVYPDGLAPLVSYVRKADMQFGLWFEPEMVNPDSDLYRNHPDWVLHLAPYETPLARNQLVLNLALEEVFDYLLEHISALVAEHHIDYIKWDYNRDVVMGGDGKSSQLLKQVPACYQLMATLNERFPELEIESCSSGGARADWGILQHTGRVWTSDSIDAIDRAQIQRGYSLFTPPEIMGAHVGHAVAHLTGREINIHTRAIIALQGQFGYEVDARHLSQSEILTLNYYVKLYKRHREWICESTSWRLDSPVRHLVCSGLVSEDKQQSLWFAVAESSLSTTAPGVLYPCGLNVNMQYTVTLASENFDQLAHFSKHIPQWLSHPVTLSGHLLMSVGLTLPILPAQCAILLEITAV
ncbi:hypothetical protein AB833_01050 [Chromatiales bacterium (ex Bugula neritina AB1)]|nr:hypothetical protein AB833_01050 [Chromatiales bacterium (ex Bugula neritina AB1)]